ncbi:hypothetical protein CMUS01_16314 [Colletotrichum musicola]|uniref:Uncharacterized protein n=2 Tax=Colletotrichum orchidearum species complex TaxID=2707337 RepID=A0A8H6IPZ4_9PEZI|nr:hypothetical protein CMUS01_16314 [Colletotrichum musicola]
MKPLQLTAWGFKSINQHASKAVKKLAKDITLARRTLNPRIDEDNKPVQFNGGTRSNADSIWHQLFGHEHRGSARCRHCREGCGPFAECVQVVDACANCRYGGTAVRCEFHPRNVTPAKRKAEESMDAAAEDTVSDILSNIPAKYLKEVRRAIDMALAR